MGGLNQHIAEGSIADLPTSKLKLSILIGMDSFNYMVVDDSDRILMYKSLGLSQPVSSHSYSEFEHFFRSDAVLNRTFESSVITTCSSYYTLVPKKLFKKEAADSYLQQVTDLAQRYVIKSDQSSNEEATCVFGLHHFLDEWFEERFPKARITHMIPQLIRLAKRHNSTAQNRLYLYLTGHRLGVVLWKDGQLHYSNIFTVYDEAQLVYYIGLVFNQFNIQQTNTEAYYLGAFHPDHHLYKILDRYLDQPVLLGPPRPFSIYGDVSRVSANLLALPAVATL